MIRKMMGAVLMVALGVPGVAVLDSPAHAASVHTAYLSLQMTLDSPGLDSLATNTHSPVGFWMGAEICMGVETDSGCGALASGTLQGDCEAFGGGGSGRFTAASGEALAFTFSFSATATVVEMLGQVQNTTTGASGPFRFTGHVVPVPSATGLLPIGNTCVINSASMFKMMGTATFATL